MDILTIAFRLLLALALGAVLGFERELNQKKITSHNNIPTAVLGLRSFSLMTIFGAITGFIYLTLAPLALVIATAFFAILCIFYFLDSYTSKDYGLTTEITALYSFIIGLLLATDVLPIQIVIAVTIIVTLLLSQKDNIKNIVIDIKHAELNAFISYAILVVVIMPFLPNTSYSLGDIKGLAGFLNNINIPVKSFLNVDLFNPFKTWLILVLITGVDFVSYVLSRIIGQKSSWLLTSVLGGLVSSTATTQALAKQSKSIKKYNYLIAAAVLANLVSFLQISVLIGVINGKFLVHLFPVIALMLLAAMVFFFYFLKSGDVEKAVAIEQKEDSQPRIIDLAGALKFAGLYLIISVISKIALILFGQAGLLITTGIGAMIGLDAVMINTSQLAGQTINMNIAILAFIIANSVNLIAKSAYTFAMGSKTFAVKFSISMMALIAISFLGYIFS